LIRVGLLALAMLAAPAVAGAGVEVDQRMSAGFTGCLNNAGSTMAQVACIADELKAHDRQLNSLYQSRMRSLTAPQRAKLQAAQRAWLVYRDADCRSYEDADWGTLSRVNANSCVLERTIERVIQLENYPPST
jgi:uncharacterized protein YecT (DUF1311 family)